jgi:cysteine-rich repeat protein
VCGNGALEKFEECDDGNTMSGDGCENDCRFTCVAGDPKKGDAKCDDANACNGAETCSGSHTCLGGTPLGEGAPCGQDLVCVKGNCQAPSCGDGQKQPGEECDDGNAAPGDGCEPACKLTCLSTDPARNCKSTNVCVEDGTCDDGATHVCTPGAKKQAGLACGGGKICLGGDCVGSSCGDGFVDAAKGEACEDGNDTPGDGCEPGTCKYSCSTPATDCAAAPACKVNACTGAHVCQTNADTTKNGQVCGNGMVCDNGDCKAAAQVCGNGVKEGAEVCDDGNQTPGDGCEPGTCKYSCNAPATDCAPPPVCNAAVCADVTAGGNKVGQKCSTVPANNGQSPAGCAAPNTCQNGACTPPGAVCGDGVLQGGEQCDFGTGNGPGTGCETNCKFSCAKTPTDTCPDANPCNGTEVCSTVTVGGKTGQKCSAGSPSPDGTACGAGSICLAGSCVLSKCGDGFTDTAHGEQCDFGAANGPGTGCETNCKFSCAKTPTDTCPDANACNGTEICNTVTVGGKTGQKCSAGTQQPVGTSCGSPNLICIGSPIVCAASKCGDGYVDAKTGEQCEPPSTATCDASCKTVTVAKCGNNALEGAEQCDDANGTPKNLDGCDTACKYEAMTRMTAVQISGSAAPATCTPTTNAFGRQVLTSTARDNMNGTLRDDVNAGKTNVIMQMLGLDDLTGTADPALQLGILSAQLDPARGAWPGNNPIDWWFLIAPSTLDPSDLPNSRFTNAAVAARQITAGPNDVTLALLLGGTVANLRMRDARLFATVDNPPAPDKPAPPPTLLASSVSVLRTITATAAGKGLCGNITVESLAAIPIPQSLTQGTTSCSSSCSGSHAYTYCGEGNPVSAGCNSLLDAIVGGCQARVIVCINAINPSQPDVAGAGYQGTLSVGAGNKVPASQTQGNTRAYSAFFTFAANRAHATGKAQ